ncbi:hypothetical protein GYMLUDRAFT_208245 [Collybiopsis luxurians FD-317 M1]|uniref:Large ribosomal subunit protein uL29m n=1 Tax=Collybiopsis luxurians FD-317 M1 TaxID=944289 RepID=A0A0D0C2J1_9AGAR|nr:hypothetical protein GYMLUDRAFT_208245 [Collybiopsis luxurians FD-317 M1]
MLTVLRRSCTRSSRLFSRNFAEIVPAATPLKGTIDPPPPGAITGPNGANTETNSKVVAPVRLGNRVPVREDHGLYAFFRKKEPAPGQTLVGEAQYETLGGTPNMEAIHSGRSWKASELRLKSFEDLHVLWYILLRERNLLATQQEEVRRLGALRLLQIFNRRTRMCRKSMARIKYVMNERRLAYEGAVKLAEEQKTAHTTKLVLQQQLADHQKERQELFGRQRSSRLKLAAKRAAEKRAAKEQEQAEAAEEIQAVGEAAPLAEVAEAAPTVESVETKEDAPETPKVEAVPSEKPGIKSSPRKLESATDVASAGLFGSKHQ